VRTPKTAEVVAEIIRRDIVTGVLREGDKLPAESVLIERFGVSKPSIREAFRILESESMLEIRRGAHGALVRLPDEVAAGRVVGTLLQLRGTTLADVWRARTYFEPPLAAELAQHRTDRDLSQLRHAIAEHHQTMADPPAFALVIVDFHELVVSLAGNETLTVVVQLLDEIVRRHVAAVAADFEGVDHDDLRQHETAVHEEFVELIERRQAAEAQIFWYEHLKNSKAVSGRGGSRTVLDLYRVPESPGA
jgi:GntR family transcriptional repressor for pyruvate dehydrogenase complex